jgi:hypothetical protein
MIDTAVYDNLEKVIKLIGKLLKIKYPFISELKLNEELHATVFVDSYIDLQKLAEYIGGSPDKFLISHITSLKTFFPHNELRNKADVLEDKIKHEFEEIVEILRRSIDFTKKSFSLFNFHVDESNIPKDIKYHKFKFK